MANVDRNYVLLVAWIAVVFSNCGTTNGYKRYEVEDHCKGGHMVISLAANGSESAGILKATRHTSISLIMDCQVSLVSPDDHGVLVSIRQVGLRTTIYGTCRDYLRIQWSPTTIVTMCNPFLDLDEAQSYATYDSKNTMALIYHTDTGLDNRTMSGYPGFQLTFTAFLSNNSAIPLPSEDWFQCNNGRVIWAGLKCDGHNNCGDRSDENIADCGVPGKAMVAYLVAAIVLVVAMFVGCMVAVVVKSKRRRRRTASNIPVLLRT